MTFQVRPATDPVARREAWPLVATGFLTPRLRVLTGVAAAAVLLAGLYSVPSLFGVQLLPWWALVAVVVLGVLLGATILARVTLWASVEFGRRGDWWHLTDHRGEAVVRVRDRPGKSDRWADTLSAVPQRLGLGYDLMTGVKAAAPTPVRGRAVKKTAAHYRDKWNAQVSDRRLVSELGYYRVKF